MSELSRGQRRFIRKIGNRYGNVTIDGPGTRELRAIGHRDYVALFAHAKGESRHWVIDADGDVVIESGVAET